MKDTATLVVIVLVIVLVILLLSGAGMMGFGMMGPRMMGYGMMGGWGYNPLGWVLTFVFWALVIGGIVLLVVWLARSVGRTQSDDAALEILKARYARGEISKEQFEEMKKVLEAK